MLSCGAILSRNARQPLQKRTLDLAKIEGCFNNHIFPNTRKNLEQIQCQKISTTIVNGKFTQEFGIQRFHTNSLLSCSTRVRNINRSTSKINIHNIMNNENNNSSDEIIDNIVSEHEKETFEKPTNQLTHIRHKEKYSLRDIERMYPNPKAKIHDIFQIITHELQNKNALKMSYTTENIKKKIWTCTVDVQWPFELSFIGVGHNKNSSGNAACLKCLHYLENNRRLSPIKKPIIYSPLEVKNILHRPVRLDINEQVLDEVKNVVDRYEDEVKLIIEDFENNKNTTFEIQNNDITNENSTNFQPGAIIDPVGRSNPVNREPEKIRERNKILLGRYEHRMAHNYNSSNVLPIIEFRDKIINEIENNQVMVIKGDTGCGKTTQVPQFIMDSFASREKATDCNIIVAQPRRISAISLAERIAAERREQIGDVVGYQVRLSQELPNTPAGILFCTTGILLRKLQFNQNLEGCSHVIVDEAHERTINTDMLLALLKRAMNNNKNLKIIIMSATINAGLFQDFFNCGVVQVPGRTYPVEMNFMENIDAIGLRSPSRYDMSFDENNKLNGENPGPIVDIVKMGELISWINRNKPPGAILVFLPGWSEIMKMKKYLEDFSLQSSKRQDGIFIVPVHSKMSHFDQKKIFETPPQDVRKIVLATDIAETGITVTDVVYVVDSCTARQVKWDDKRGISSIDSQWSSQANINQRKGRAGRVKPGTSYHFISRDMFDQLEKYPVPEIKRSSLEKTVLDAKTYSSEKALEFLSSMPEPPTPNIIRSAVNELIELGALDNDENLTPLGKRIALFTVHPKLSKSMVYSSIFQCLSPMMTIASAMSADQQIFQGQLHNKDGIRKIKEEYSPTSDHTSIGWLFQQWHDYNRSGRYEARDFCMKSRLYPDKMYTLSKVRELNAEHLIHAKMMDNIYDLNDFDSKINSYSELDEIVKGVLLAGTDQLLLQRDFDVRKGVLKKGTPTFTMEDGNRATITPESVNFKKRNFPSPFLTYVMKTHSEERRMSLIRETSIISPLTAFLFSQGRFTGHFQNRDININLDNDECDSGFEDDHEVLLSIQGRKNMKLICTKETAEVMLKFRDAMWSIVRYIVANQGFITAEESENYCKVDDCKESILQVLAHMLSLASEKIDCPDKKQNENNKQKQDELNDEEYDKSKDW